MTIKEKSASLPELIDPRGPRVTASITLIVLGAAFLTHSTFLILLQLIQFTIGGFVSPKKAPYGIIYRKLIQPRLAGDFIGEDIRGPQFAQKVGFLFAVLATIGALSKIDLLFQIPVILALAAAFLNAVFDYCLGCQIYLLLQRATKR
ncbi:MAG: DUF4395 domain-containing protein [Actinomycetes bacterium]|jgi:Domain of unknown function (DUF4395)